MLFNTLGFVFLFLPVVWVGHRLLGPHPRTRLVWLVGASLLFYGWWNPRYLILILSSVAVNYAIAHRLTRETSRWLITLGVTFNLALLGYFKYAGFFVHNANATLGTEFSLPSPVLPLAISFFTFQQIAFLVDVHQGKAQARGLAKYTLFVTFFPQLIAGPIVHHSEMMPQFEGDTSDRRSRDTSEGLAIFALGLAKKVLIADTVAGYANVAFDTAAGGTELSMAAAWLGALAYTVQLYFDFSGYSDMAIGLGRLFGIHIPLNFNSPYKATSIIDFWRRWHMTLSRFLRDYLYIPLGGNRLGVRRRYLNLLITMLLGGLWHGAGWTFVIWGGLHGVYLLVNNAFRSITERQTPSRFGRGSSRVLTLLAVVVGWVFFRAADVNTAMAMLDSMFLGSSGGVLLPDPSALEAAAIALGSAIPRAAFATLFTSIALAMALFAPNSQEIVLYGRRDHPTPRWRPRAAWGFAAGCLVWLAVLTMQGASEFLYFQF